MEIYRELYQISKDLREFTIKAKRLHMLIKNDWQERILDPEVFRGRDAEGNYILYKQEIPLLIERIQSLLDQQRQELLEKITLEFKRKSVGEWDEKSPENFMDSGYNQAVDDLEQLKQSV